MFFRFLAFDPYPVLTEGRKYAPMHPHCRCSVAAWEDDEEYEAWLDYLAKGGSTEEWNATGKAEWAKSKKRLKILKTALL